jgi:hypothetical protein
MKFDIHITCKACKERLELATPPEHHQNHLHFRCRCMPPDGLLCVLMRPSLTSTAKG